jgi:putative transcriptional regulator
MQPTAGSLLVAPPTMQDRRFARTVLLVTHNNQQGTFALCLNKPTKNTLVNLSKELKLDKELPFSVDWGGPVNPGSIWMVHDKDWDCGHSLYINEKINVTSNEAMFHHMADGDCPRQFKLLFGFCSWMPGQLDMELEGTHPFNKQSSWLVVNDVDPEFIFETPVDKLWEKSVALAGNQTVANWM